MGFPETNTHFPHYYIDYINPVTKASQKGVVVIPHYHNEKDAMVNMQAPK